MVKPLVNFERLRIETVQAPDGRLLLLHSDVCRALGLKNSTLALARLLPEERVTAREALGPKGRNVWLTTVSGFWRLALSSQKTAEKLKGWLCGELLPTLTAEGRYTVPGTLPLRDDLEATARTGRLSRALARTLKSVNLGTAVGGA